jgi:hypothetical protein
MKDAWAAPMHGRHAGKCVGPVLTELFPTSVRGTGQASAG